VAAVAGVVAAMRFRQTNRRMLTESA